MTPASETEIPSWMKAIVQDRYGGADRLRLQSVSTPNPEPGEVLVRVRAAAICKGDVHLMTGRPYLVRTMFGLLRPKNRVIGQEVAGTVVAAGSDVLRLKVGDEVFGPVGHGAFAEYVRAPESRLAHKPASLGFEPAAAIGDSALAALQSLRDAGGARSGHQVLIHGASGGVGTFAVQIARALGARVTAVCSTRHVELMSEIGANRVIDYTLGDLAGQADTRFDVILDMVGNRSLEEFRSLLSERGVLVALAGPPGHDWIGPLLWMLSTSRANRRGPQTFKTFLVETRQEDLVVLADWATQGALSPVIEQTLPLEEAPKAMRHVATGHARGKTVLEVKSVAKTKATR
ncbi:MAG: NAD(P)-dependent alcohol dehydrogenase [Planctomycetota bacterium]